MLKPLCNSVPTFIIKVKLSGKAFVQLGADFYHQGETQCWSLCNSVPTFIMKVKLSGEAFVQLSADFYHQSETKW